MAVFRPAHRRRGGIRRATVIDMPRKTSSRIVRIVADRLWARDRMQMRAADALLSAVERRKRRTVARRRSRAPSVPWHGFQSILCPIDFSRHAQLALRYAGAIALRNGATLTVVHVNDPLLLAAASAALHDTNMEQRSQSELRSFVDSTIAAASGSRPRLTTAVSVGTPADVILRLARRAHADLIVMGTHGLTGAARVLLGSTTASVLKRSTIPVLAIPPRRRAR
jgi:nucleotide-binding universal stress UspA family protein